MPTYDYECRSCGYKFEKLQGINDDSLTDCPECRKSELRRIIGGGMGIIFKGSGFYVNDSRKSSSGKVHPSAKKNDSGKSEKKPEKEKSKSSEKKTSA